MSKLTEKFAYIAFGVCLLGASWFSGCKSTPEVAPPSPIADIQNLGREIANTGTDLAKTTENIRTNATDGMKATPDTAKPTLNPFWTNILTATGVQDQLVKNLEEMTHKAELAEKKTADMEAWGVEQEKQKKAAQDSVTKELRQKYMAYSGTLFFLALICGGIAVFSKGNRLALYGGLLCGAGSAVCIFIVQTVALIPWIVGGLGIITLGLIAYSLFFKNKKADVLENKAAVLETAVKESVETIEAVKPHMTVAGRRKVFGDGPGKGDAYSIQSIETEKLVKEIRKEIENAPPIPKTVAADYNGDGVIDERDICPNPLVSPIKAAMPRKKPFTLS